MNELMRADILDQPEATQQTLPSLRMQLDDIEISSHSSGRIIFSGSGDSYFAPLALQYAARIKLAIEMDVYVLPAQDATQYWQFSSRDIFVPISFSGEARHTLEAASTARDADAFVLGITGNTTSSLAEVSDNALVIEYHGRSRKTPHATDYTTTLLAVAALVEHFSESRIAALDDLVEQIAHAVEHLEGVCRDVANELVDAEHFYFLGAGPNFATAQYGAAKFWEAGGITAFFFELEEFAHGPHLLVDPGDPVFLIAPHGNSLERAIEIVSGLQQIGVNLFVITDTLKSFAVNSVEATIIQTPSTEEEWSPFVTSIALQWLCWAVATEKGYDVVKKDGRRPNPEIYEAAHRAWVR